MKTDKNIIYGIIRTEEAVEFPHLVIKCYDTLSRARLGIKRLAKEVCVGQDFYTVIKLSVESYTS